MKWGANMNKLLIAYFSSEYQARAHQYTEEIFGKGQTFKAGTIGTVKDKIAYGMVRSYAEERGFQKSRCEIDRLARGCSGVKRGTSQHPGGIIVLPKGEDINTFTPVQHPANDMSSSIITTHFDYHSIDHNSALALSTKSCMNFCELFSVGILLH